MIYKKLVSIFIIFFLMANSSYAATGYFDDIVGNSISNVTPGRVIQEVNGAGKLQNTTFTTTSVFFRFGNATGQYPQPWFSFSPPKVSVGCGGISLKGMFASIIGLDQLEEQLKNAGTSIAWGIVVGLIYSLPGIGAALRMIDTWAKKIQQLLANACQSAANFTQGFIKSHEADISSFMDKTGIDKIPGADYVKMAQDPDLFKSANDGFNNFFANNGFDSNMLYQSSPVPPVSPTQISDNWRKSLLATIPAYSVRVSALTYLINTMNADQKTKFFTKIFGALPTNYKSASFAISLSNDIPASGSSIPVFSLKTLMSTYTSLPVSKVEATGRMFTSIAIASSTASDTGVSGNDTGIGSIEETFTSLQKIYDANTSINTSTMIKDFLAGNGKIVTYSPVNTSLKDPQSIASVVLQYLTYGTNAKYPQAATVNDTLMSIPPLTYTVMAIDAKQDAATASTDNPMVFVIAATGNDGVSDKSWFPTTNITGAKEKTTTMIEGMLAGQSYTTLSAASDSAVLVPGMLQKIKILQQSSPVDREKYKQLLIDYNTYMIVSTAFDGISSSFSNIKTSSPVFLVGLAGAGEYTNNVNISDSKITELRKVTNSMNSSLSVMKKSVPDVLAKFTIDKKLQDTSEIEYKFEELDKKNTKEAIKTAPQAK
jgi:hypothetical protein